MKLESKLFNYSYYQFRKDFMRAKKHQICYKKIFDDDIDFENLEVEVNSHRVGNSKSYGDSTDLESEGEEGKQIKKNQDAFKNCKF